MNQNNQNNIGEQCQRTHFFYFKMHCKVTVVTQCGTSKSMEQIKRDWKQIHMNKNSQLIFLKVQMQFSGESIVASINRTGTVGCLSAPQKKSEPILQKFALNKL